MMKYDVHMMTYVINCVLRNEFIEHEVSWFERKKIDFYLSNVGRLLFPEIHTEYSLLYVIFEKEKEQVYQRNLHKSYLSMSRLRLKMDSPTNSISEASSTTTDSSNESHLLYKIPNEHFDYIDQV